MIDYIKNTLHRDARPRSRRLRELGAAPSASSVTDVSLLSRLAALEDLFEVVGDGVHVKGGRGLYSDSYIAALGRGSGSQEGAQEGGSSVKWVQMYPAGSNAQQIASVTVDGVTIPVYAPKGGGGGSVAALSDVILDSPRYLDTLMYDGRQWVNQNVYTILSSDFVAKNQQTVEFVGNIKLPTTRAVYLGDGSNSYIYYDEKGVLQINCSGGINLATGSRGQLTHNGSAISGGSTTVQGSTVSVQRLLSSGTQIARLTIDGVTTTLYAPSGDGSSEPVSVALASLTDVDVRGVSAGDVLYYDGSNWIPYASSNFGGSSSGGGSSEPAGDHYIGTTKTQSSAAPQALTGITSLTATGQLKGGALSVTGAASVASLSVAGYIALGNARLAYENGVLKLTDATGASCSFSATGNISAGGTGSGGGSQDGGSVTVVDSLTSTSTASALSANQGRVLKGLIDSLSLSSLSGVSVTGASAGDVLYYNGQKWSTYSSSNFSRRQDHYIGTTKTQSSAAQQALTGITSLAATDITVQASLRIGDAKLTYSDGVLSLQKADGSACSLFANGNISSGQ